MLNHTSVAALCLACVSLYVGINYLLYYLRSHQRRELLWFSAMCFTIAFYDVCAALLYSADLVLVARIWQKGQIAALCCLAVFLIFFVFSFLNKKLKKWDYGIAGFFAFGALLVLADPGDVVWTSTPMVKKFMLFGKYRIVYREMEPGVFLNFVDIMGGILGIYLIYLLFADWRRTKRDEIRPVMYGLLVLALGVFNDAAVESGVYQFVYLIEYAYLFMIVGMSASLTASHVKAQLDLRLSKGELVQLAAAVNEAAESIMITNPDGVITYVNPCFERMTGYSASEAVGKTATILHSGKHDDAFYTNLWNELKKGEVWHGGFTNRRKDGTLYEETAAISPIHDAKGKVVSYVAVKRDVTQERELEEQLRQSQKMEAIGHLAGKVAHDFTNYLVAVFGHGQMLKNMLSKTSEGHKHIDEILATANKASALTSELLAFAQHRASELKEMDLHKLIRGIRHMLDELIEDSCNLEVNMCEDPLPVNVDQSQIEEFVLQFVVNARDAMQEQGHLTLEASWVDMDKEETTQLKSAELLENRPDGRFVILQISDDGMGMDDATQSHIFEPFFSTKGHSSSSGLGLSVTHGMIRQHNGYITVYSKKDIGTTFSIYLPMVEKEGSVPKREVKPFGDGRSVLVVESEGSVRRVLTGILKALGFAVLEAEDIEEAALLAKEKGNLTILVSDIVAEKAAGAEVVKSIERWFAGKKVVYISGFADHHVRRLGWLPEGVPCVCVPFTKARVGDALREILD